MKNILLLIPSLNFGGAQRSMTKISIELSKSHCVYLATFNNDVTPAFAYGGTLIDLKVPGGGNYVSKVYYFLLRYVRVRRIKKEKNIHTCISYMDGANYVNVLSKVGEKTVISVRGSQLYDETIRGVVGLIRLKLMIPVLYRLADEIIALNEGIKRELSEYAKIEASKIKVINNFYDKDSIIRKSKQEVEPYIQHVFHNNKVIITAGRLAPEKGLIHLLRIFSELRNQCFNVTLMIVGDGIMRNELISLASELKLNYYAAWEDNEPIEGKKYDVFFIGYKENPFKYIAKADIFTLTSSSEGGPNILSEAMICGTATVSVDCPSGPREKLASIPEYNKNIQKAEYAEYGILMPVLFPNPSLHTIIEWVNTLKKILEDSYLRQRYEESGRKRMDNFTREKIFALWEETIQN